MISLQAHHWKADWQLLLTQCLCDNFQGYLLSYCLEHFLTALDYHLLNQFFLQNDVLHWTCANFGKLMLDAYTAFECKEQLLHQKKQLPLQQHLICKAPQMQPRIRDLETKPA
uniref:HOBBIT family protein n=1 Tax=Rhizophora mucronata TaxID=61149 RepID=A0A2P2LI64_RHIMU